ncbi:protein translocase subunit SecD [Streptomyces griseocarneus]|uniref:protein translocase subunit SecD n=1 Tax=Streptomyces griseocarneus TaxID=51201 RepID=UPI00167E2F84|nr:protein translocase subunit SecD [Streptomyces griseocarneus]MBZ6474455.1 protein translocase subunit SecD [Streptomyces griseocarneus]GHG68184.1 protein translocase subunit SecD [Streptomyces griseocarneus]
MAAPKKGRRSPGGQGRPGRVLALILIAMVALTGGMFASGHTTPRLGIDLAGGTSFTLEAKNQPGRPNAINATNMNTAVGIIERRVNGLGVTESEVQTQGDNHIIVNIPKGTDAKQARQQVGTTAQLGFRPVLTATAGVKTPEPAPGATGDKDKGDKAKQDEKTGEKNKGDKSTGATTKPSGSPSPTASASPQGRPVTDALKADKDDATPGASASASAKADGKKDEKKAPTPTPAPGDAAALQKKLDALDCSTKEGRAKANEAAAGAAPTDMIVACRKDGQVKEILGPVAVEGTNVSDASAVFDTQQGKGWLVQLKFDSTGAKKFAQVTGQLATKQSPQNQFAIVLDGEVVSDPSVTSSIGGGQAEISGGFTQQSASELANVLSYGALPLSFDVVTETTVTAALGGEQLRAGLIAGAIGLALVIVYLVAYYRGLALVALASLAVSAILTYTIMVLLGPAIGFALNLPAVCGAIVAIGITADSFIVYFERIRDEIREGRTLRPAVERGWPRARRTILVSDFVSFLAAAVLFIVTVGKVQGFAFTLGLTTLLDVVVVFLFTKPLMTVLARRKFFASGHPWSGLDPARLGVRPPLRASRRRSAPVDPKEA